MSATERHLRVRRSARFYQIGSPSAVTRELWIACHGYGQLAAQFATALAPLASDTRVVLAPEGLSRMYLDDVMKRHGPDSPVGASWMTREDRDHEITDYVEYLDELAATATRELHGRGVGITALGFSQGVATVCRWAALGKARIEQLILWSGMLPLDLHANLGERLGRGARVVLVRGRRDPMITDEAVETARAKLDAEGLDVSIVAFDGGHSLNSETLRRLAKDASSAV